MQVKAWLFLTVSAAILAFTAQAQPIATLPFASNAGKAIYLTASVNGGKDGWWALDTGANDCLIDRSIARGAKLVLHGGRPISGAGK